MSVAHASCRKCNGALSFPWTIFKNNDAGVSLSRTPIIVRRLYRLSVRNRRSVLNVFFLFPTIVRTLRVSIQPTSWPPRVALCVRAYVCGDAMTTTTTSLKTFSVVWNAFRQIISPGPPLRRSTRPRIVSSVTRIPTIRARTVVNISAPKKKKKTIQNPFQNRKNPLAVGTVRTYTTWAVTRFFIFFLFCMPLNRMPTANWRLSITLGCRRGTSRDH